MQAEVKWRMQDQTIVPNHIISEDINYYIYFVIQNIKSLDQMWQLFFKLEYSEKERKSKLTDE